MSKSYRLASLSLVLMGLGAALLIRQQLKPVADVGAASSQARPPSSSKQRAGTLVAAASTTRVATPRLVELGSHSCASCQAMFPVLDTLRSTYGTGLQVDFIDVWKNKQAAQQYRIRLIPSQVLYNAKGEEVFRHEGFLPATDIAAAFKRGGVRLSAVSATPSPAQPSSDAPSVPGKDARL